MIADLQTAPHMHVLCMIKYASLPECFSQGERSSVLQRKAIWITTLHSRGNN